MKKFLILLLLAGTLMAAEGEMAQKIRRQNIEVVKAAAEAMNASLPKKVDDYTKLLKIEPDGERLVYIFEVDAGPRSDEDLKKRRESRTRVVTQGICATYGRFLKSGIVIVYRYVSAATKRPLFDVAVSEKECPNLMD
ncbi:hypothetical protein [Hydrogenimonas sp.]